jgi:hypothetical protein
MSEYPVPPFYKGYISLTGDGSLVELLQKNRNEILGTFENLPESKWIYRYATGKWSIKELLQHMTDTERIMAYRALCFSRGDKTSLPGFEQDDYVNALKIEHLGREEMLEEWKSVRDASIIFFRNLDPELFLNEGVANGNHLNVELLGKIIVGHTRHHLKIIKEKYLS